MARGTGLEVIIEKAADDGGIKLSLVTCDDLPTIHADERSVTQIAQNLLSNAIKFSPVGGEIKFSYTIEENQQFALRMTDQGIGIPSAQLEKVFPSDL